MPDDNQALCNTTPSEGFAYFSGNAPNNNNHPAIYARGYGRGESLVVTGCGTRQTFSMCDFDDAVAHYKELLQQQGYHPGEKQK